ncbi:MAG: PQQ-like beta-propeller repeat protein [Treponemataceae bacterium]|nr:PQQ-like beta-propeller repeat protein [Treponemataceae bacterium]
MAKVDAQSLAPLWQKIASGRPIGRPQPTSYGFLTITDGRMFCTFTQSGDIVSQRRISRPPSGLFSVTEYDSVYVVSRDKSFVTYYNPDGILLWEQEFSDLIAAPPLPGKNGTVFVQTNDTIFCLGINGSILWSQDMKHDIAQPLVHLNDGSLLCIVETDSSSPSTGYRLSPYGSFLEEIIFTGKVCASQTVSEGVLLGFTDGTVGLCRVSDSKAQSLWSCTEGQNLISSALSASFAETEHGYAVLFGDGTLFYLDKATHSIVWNKRTCANGILCYKEGIIAVTSDVMSPLRTVLFELDGNKVWDHSFTDTGFFCFLSAGKLVLFSNSWTVSCFRTYQTTFSEKSLALPPIKYGAYDPQNQTESEIAEIQEILSDSLYRSTVVSSIVRDDFSQFAEDANLIPQYITALYDSADTETDFSPYIAQIIATESDASLLRAALSAAAISSFDPNHAMINAIENRLFSLKIQNTSDAVYQSLSDAVCAICRYMGTPVLMKQGQRILSTMLSNNFSYSVRQLATNAISTLLEITNR